MQNFLRNTLVFLAIFFLACENKDTGAEMRLSKARDLYSAKDYERAKQEIDSIRLLYPKAYPEIKAGLALLDSVRRGENEQSILECDSLINIYTTKIEKMKSLFVFQKNKEYQETGTYIPKESATGNTITGTTLRSGVGEDGILYLESVFTGGKQKHDRIRIAAKDGSQAESLRVTDDGLNYRFSNMDKDYEIIRFSGVDENGVAEFIYTNKEGPLTITLDGLGKYSYPLSQSIKSAVSKSFELSIMMLQLDSLKSAKEKAEYRIYYLDNEKGGKNIDEHVK